MLTIEKSHNLLGACECVLELLHWFTVKIPTRKKSNEKHHIIQAQLEKVHTQQK